MHILYLYSNKENVLPKYPKNENSLYLTYFKSEVKYFLYFTKYVFYSV